MDLLDPDEATGETFWKRVFDEQNKGTAGKKTDYPLKHEFVTWGYTRHNDGSLAGERVYNGMEILATGAVRNHSDAKFAKGLSTTRFHKGFQRRMQFQIRQDKPRLEREAFKQRQSSLHLNRRRQWLGTLDKRNGFNVITGEFDPANRRCTTPFHVQPTTRESGLLSEVAERAEHLLLRDSKYKFHAPAWSGKNHDKRQDLLQRDGLNKPKKSTLLGIGSADLASAGVEDMFSKAIYDPEKACAVEGLVEMSIPGRYTPRKLAARRSSSTLDPLSVVQGNTTVIEGHNSRFDGRSLSSTSTLDTVFRIIPTGLGIGGTLGGRGGGAIPGIAPPKRLKESHSTPSISQDPRKTEPKVSRGKSMPLFPAQSPVPSGSSSKVSINNGVVGRESESTSANRFPKAVGEMTGGRAATAGSRGAFLERDGMRRSRGLSRSRSDFERGSIHSSSRSAGGSGTAGVDFFRKSISVGRLTPAPLVENSNMLVSARTGSVLSRGASPAQRRTADQLALDFATVRSLDT